MGPSNSSIEGYSQYLATNYSNFSSELQLEIERITQNTAWDDPCCGLDWNNLGVVALVEAEQSDDLTMRAVYLDMAVEAFQNGKDGHPLCSVHLALTHSLLGDDQTAAKEAFTLVLNALQPVFEGVADIPKGLIYRPSTWKSSPADHQDLPTEMFQTPNGLTQVLNLACEVLWRSRMVFYHPVSLRFLQFAAQIAPNSVAVNLRLGISSLVNQQWEGLLYLHRARELDPENLLTLQALQIAYQDLGQLNVANHWLNIASDLHQQKSSSVAGRWTEVPTEQPYTYVPFEDNLLLAVEHSFRSIVTSVQIAEGDWFEREMEFWRSWIQPGMTVIDVGANVGVYTFSAAKRVGPEGRVIAVEPFSGCVRCLKETCRVNQLDWVKIYAGAASDRNGTAHLSLNTASELNELIATDTTEGRPTGASEEVACYTLDSLCDQENLEQVAFLKIDAEGHEISVLAGCENILSKFLPVILYENIAGNHGSNLETTDYLHSKGYNIYHYQPFLQQLIPIDLDEDCQGYLNLIAWHHSKPLTHQDKYLS